MALVVEDGTGKADAQVYASEAQLDEYCEARGITLADDFDAEVALLKGAEYMTNNYRFRWQGRRVSVTQRLDWPRYDVYLPDVYAFVASDVVPEGIVFANIEFALRHENLSPDVERLEKRFKVGPIEIEYEGGSSSQTEFQAAIDQIAVYLSSANSGMVAKLSRS